MFSTDFAVSLFGFFFVVVFVVVVVIVVVITVVGGTRKEGVYQDGLLLLSDSGSKNLSEADRDAGDEMACAHT